MLTTAKINRQHHWNPTQIHQERYCGFGCKYTYITKNKPRPRENLIKSGNQIIPHK